ncbi:MAG: hypothetical protein PHQ75_05880 [Thermoguttaceae bacterium]|nr:hypothetical protein [Thermoguttaceae bacterium]
MDNVICMKWGTKFAPEYVNILAQNVKKHLARPHRFVCFTDDATGLRPEIEVQPLPPMDLPAHLPERGWRKLTLFQEKLGDLEGQALFLDLDVLIVDDLDPLFEYPGKFLIIRDWNLPGRDIGNSSVFRFELGAHPDNLTTWLEHGPELRKQFRNEQALLSYFMRNKGILEYWPESWCLSFKKHYMRKFPLGYLLQPKPVEGAKIIVFHGNPNPDAIRNGWHSSNFLRAVRPTPWMAKFWREE